MTTYPPDDSNTHTSNEGFSRDQPNSVEERSEPERGPLPSEMRIFISDLNELLRQVKKFVVFIRNRRNTNALLVALTFALAIATFTQAVIYGIQLGPLRRSADAAKESASTAANELELSERPWVNADISLCQPQYRCDNDGALFYNVNGANITLHLTLHNGGHSPALATYVNTRLFAGGNPVEASKYVADVCRDANRVSLSTATLGTAVFPTTSPETFISTSIPSSELEANEALKVFPNSNFPPHSILSYAAVVCIAYRPNFKSTVYDSAYVLDLFKVTQSGELETLFKIGEDVEAKRLLLRLHPINAIQAN